MRQMERTLMPISLSAMKIWLHYVLLTFFFCNLM